MENVLKILNELKLKESGDIKDREKELLNSLFCTVNDVPIKSLLEKDEKNIKKNLIIILSEFKSDLMLFRVLSILNTFTYHVKFLSNLTEICNKNKFSRSLKFISNNSNLNLLDSIDTSENLNTCLEFLYRKFKNKVKIFKVINSYDTSYKIKNITKNPLNYKFLNSIFEDSYNKDVFNFIYNCDFIKSYMNNFSKNIISGVNFINFIDNHTDDIEKLYLIDYIIDNSHNDKFLSNESYKLRHQFKVYENYSKEISKYLYEFDYNSLRRIIKLDFQKFKLLISLEFLNYNLSKSIKDRDGILFLKFLYSNDIFKIENIKYILENTDKDSIKKYLNDFILEHSEQNISNSISTPTNTKNFYVYKFLNSKKDILYIGKTSDMWNRMSSHKSNSNTHEDCIKETSFIEYIKTNSENEASIYEIYYISKLKPIYNKEYNVSTYITIDLPTKKWYQYKFSMSEKIKNIKELMSNV